MPSSLNTGKTNVGGSSNKSYGNQSPAVDAVPLAWLAGDHRYYMGVNPTIIGWVCTVSGTPGTWVQITTGGAPPANQILMDIPFLYGDSWDTPRVLPGHLGHAVYGAPATDDWQNLGEGGETFNYFAVPNAGGVVPGHMRLVAAIHSQETGINVANGITIDVVNLAGAIVGGGTATTQINADPATIGVFDLFGFLPIADVAIGSQLALRVTVNIAVVTFGVFWTFQLLLFP